MRKISLLIFVLSLCSFFAKAQISDNFESYSPFTVNPAGIWTYYDGDGGVTYNYQSVTVTNLPYTGSCIVMNPTMTDPDISDTQGAHSGSQFLAIYNAMPESQGGDAGVTNTNDWIISPEMSFTDGGTLTFWARELTDQYGAEVMRVLYSTTTNDPTSFMELQQVNISSTTWAEYSYSIPAGAKYVAINCISNDIFALFLDDISLQINTSDPTIVAVPNTINFGSVSLNENATSTVNITGLNLTANITATTAAPFSVSGDGTNFYPSVTISQNGGTLFVRYTPTSTGLNNGTLSLTSGTATTNVTLIGTGIDCSRSVPYYCTFAAGSDELLCWETLDINGDADADHHGDFFFNGDFDPDNNDGIAQYFFNESYAANDWLISPPITLGINSHASFDYRIANSSYPEIFGVYVIPQGGTYQTATAVVAQHSVSNTAWATENINLSSYDNQTIRLAIHITSAADMWFIAFDNFSVEGDIPPTLTSNVTSIDFGNIRVGSTREEIAILTSTHLNEPITVTTVAPFGVSSDGVNFATSITIPANPAVDVEDILYIQFAPQEPLTYAENVLVATSTLSVNIMLKGAAYACDTITEFTFTENFALNSTTRNCWDFNDNNNDESTFSYVDGAAQYSGNATNTADDWLLSPQIALTGNQMLTFDYRTPSDQATGKFTVAAIGNGTTVVLSELIETTSSTFGTQTIDLRSLNGTYQIGFHCVSDPGAASLEIDNFVIQDMDAPYIIANPSEMSFTSVIGFLGEIVNDQTATVTGWALTEDITVSVTAPFEISTTGTNYGTTATIAVSGLNLTAELYVRYNPTEEGNHSGMVILTSGNAADTILLNGTATASMISVTPSEMTFTNNSSCVIEPSEAQTAQVIGINLTEEITVSTAAPFEISTDDETYGTSATIPVTGSEVTATLYVRYTPYESGTHSGVVNLLSGIATATITLNGTATITGGIDENGANAIAIYPNPASTLLNVEAEGYDNLQIVNLVGQVVYSANVNGHTQINVSDLSNGVYFVRLTNANGTATQKFVKR